MKFVFKVTQYDYTPILASYYHTTARLNSYKHLELHFQIIDEYDFVNSSCILEIYAIEELERLVSFSYKE